jgi:hypothetical protein
MNLTPPGGMTDLAALIMGGVILAIVILAIIALRRAIKANGAMWCLVVLFLPFVGSVITIAALNTSGERRDPK